LARQRERRFAARLLSTWINDAAAGYTSICHFQTRRTAMTLKLILRAFLKSEIEKWGPIIKKAGIYAD
jgi:hypothetical protein